MTYNNEGDRNNYSNKGRSVVNNLDFGESLLAMSLWYMKVIQILSFKLFKYLLNDISYHNPIMIVIEMC